MSRIGRTNRVLPAFWFHFAEAAAGPEDALRMVKLAEEVSAVVFLSGRPGFWGETLRGFPGELMVSGGHYASMRPNEQAVRNEMEAELIQWLSALGRTQIDYFFLECAGPLETFQINGVLEVLEMARQDGLIRNLGLLARNPYASLSLAQFNDAFDLYYFPHAEDSEVLAGLAESRRIDVLVNGIHVHRVTSSEQILEVVR